MKYWKFCLEHALDIEPYLVPSQVTKDHPNGCCMGDYLWQRGTIMVPGPSTTAINGLRGLSTARKIAAIWSGDQFGGPLVT